MSRARRSRSREPADRSSSCRAPAAIRDDGRARDIARVLGGEEDGNARDLLGPREAPQGRLGENPLPKLDGQGFDSDYNSRNTMFQYNYSHDNKGGFLLICSPVKRNQEDNVGNTGTVVRYNVSRNDRVRIFHLSGADQTLIHDNAVYVGEGLDVQLMLVTEWSGWSTGATLRNNRFYVDGTARYGHGVKRLEDGTYTMEPGWGGARDIVFEGNYYGGRHLDRPADATTAEPPPARPPIRWSVPEFDPAKPDGFDAFLKQHRAWMIAMFEQQFGRPIQLGR